MLPPLPRTPMAFLQPTGASTGNCRKTIMGELMLHQLSGQPWPVRHPLHLTHRRAKCRVKALGLSVHNIERRTP